MFNRFLCEKWWYYFKSVVAFGRIRVMEDREEILKMLRLLGAKYFPTREESDHEMDHSAHRAGMIEQRAVQIAENCRFVGAHGNLRCTSIRVIIDYTMQYRK